jgi:hypothetical protein
MKLNKPYLSDFKKRLLIVVNNSMFRNFTNNAVQSICITQLHVLYILPCFTFELTEKSYSVELFERTFFSAVNRGGTKMYFFPRGGVPQKARAGPERYGRGGHNPDNKLKMRREWRPAPA